MAAFCEAQVQRAASAIGSIDFIDYFIDYFIDFIQLELVSYWQSQSTRLESAEAVAIVDGVSIDGGASMSRAGPRHRL